MVVERPPVGIPLSGRVPGRALGSSRSRDNDGGVLQYVSWKEICPLGFSHRGDFIGERASSEVGPAGLTMGWRGQGLGRPPSGEPGSWPLRLIFGLRKALVKIGGLAFVSYNSENISCVTFLKYKNSRKQGTGTLASC
jgi:hypothetical protein